MGKRPGSRRQYGVSYLIIEIWFPVIMDSLLGACYDVRILDLLGIEFKNPSN